MTDNDKRYFQAYATFSECYKRAHKMTGIAQGIVIHSTAANNPWLKRYVLDETRCGVNSYKNYMGSENAAKGGNYTTPHAVAGLDINGEYAIANILPYNFRCYGCGQGINGSYNDTHIQIEICEDDLTDRKYCEGIFDLVAEWCAMLCRENWISVDDIVSHKEAHSQGYASNHGDPEHWLNRFGLNMDWFRTRVNYHLDKAANIIYRVQVGAFNSEDNAKAMLLQLKDKGFEGFIVRS